eukprot:14956477-Ditylum_brightwellii.AAC.1
MEKYIGEFSTDKDSKKIIEGNFDSDLTKNIPAVNYWIKNNIRQVATADSININLTAEESKALLGKQSESTSSSLSGRHYGHYKVLINHEDILEMHCIMMTLPFQYGFTPSRWMKA